MHAACRDRQSPLPRSRKQIAGIAAALLVLLVVLLWLSPSEQHLGDVVKLVYLHGALVRAGLLTFLLAGLLGLAAIVGLGRHRAGKLALGRWAWLLEASAVITWLMYSLSSVAVTYLAWGVAIAWGEPRVQASIRVLVASIALFGVGQMIGHPRFRACLAVIMAALAAALISAAGVIRHPIDPIGGSSSAAIKTFYVLINVVVLTLAGCLALWLEMGTPATPPTKASDPGEGR